MHIAPERFQQAEQIWRALRWDLRRDCDGGRGSGLRQMCVIQKRASRLRGRRVSLRFPRVRIPFWPRHNVSFNFLCLTASLILA